MEKEVNKRKIIFGLSPLAALLNSIVLMMVSQLIVILKTKQMLPTGYQYTEESFLALNIDVPWYYHAVTFVLSIILIFSWAEFKFNINPTEPLNWRTVRIKYIYILIPLLAFSSAFRAVLIHFLIAQ